MIFIGTVVEQDELVLEVEGQLFFCDFLELIYNRFQDHELIIIGLVIVIVVLIDVQKKHILVPVWSHSDAVQLGKWNSSFDFVLVFHLNEFFDENFEKVGIFEDIEDSFIGNQEDSFFTFAMTIIFKDVCGKDDLLVFVEQSRKTLVFRQIKQIFRIVGVANLHKLSILNFLLEFLS